MSRVLIAATLLITWGAAMAGAGKGKVKELGIPVRGVNWVRLHVGKAADGRECLYATMGQQGDNLFVLQIDPETGEFSQHVAQVPNSHYPTAAIWGKDDRLYVGAAYSGHLLRYDPKKGKIEDLGAINPPHDSFPCRIDNAPDGSLWIGAYGSAGLTRYDPKTGEFTRYGRMDDVDMYCYPLAAPDGIVACQVQVTRPHVVLLDPQSGEKKTVGPVITAGEPGKSVWLFRGADGELYIASSEGNFHIKGMEAQPVQTLPPEQRPPSLSDSSTCSFADAQYQEYRELVIENPEKGIKRQFHLDYEAAGSDIFLVHLGPDGRIYGSSVMPLHMFRYDPRNGDLTDLGRCSTSTGEAYSMGNLDGKMYICAYPGAVLSVYDPARPYHFGEGPDDNPRQIGRMDEISLRPRAMLTGPLGRVWTGSYPAYGTWGGPLAWYDPSTSERKSYRHILQDQSVISLAWIESMGLIAGGTSIEGGTGTHPKADEAALFLWDPVAEKSVWCRSPRQGTQAINTLVAGPDGLVYGICYGRNVRGKDFREIFVFDPKERKFVWHYDIPEGGAHDNSLQVGADGNLYGQTTEVIYRISPAHRRLEVLAKVPGGISVPGPLVGKTLYFARGPRLCAIELP